MIVRRRGSGLVVPARVVGLAVDGWHGDVVGRCGAPGGDLLGGCCLLFGGGHLLGCFLGGGRLLGCFLWGGRLRLFDDLAAGLLDNLVGALVVFLAVDEFALVVGLRRLRGRLGRIGAPCSHLLRLGRLDDGGPVLHLRHQGPTNVARRHAGRRLHGNLLGVEVRIPGDVEEALHRVSHFAIDLKLLHSSQQRMGEDTALLDARLAPAAADGDRHGFGPILALQIREVPEAATVGEDDHLGADVDGRCHDLGEVLLMQPTRVRGQAVLVDEAESFIHFAVVLVVVVRRLGAMACVVNDKVVAGLHRTAHDLDQPLQVGQRSVRVVQPLEGPDVAELRQLRQVLREGGACQRLLGLLVVQSADDHVDLWCALRLLRLSLRRLRLALLRLRLVRERLWLERGRHGVGRRRRQRRRRGRLRTLSARTAEAHHDISRLLALLHQSRWLAGHTVHLDQRVPRAYLRLRRRLLVPIHGQTRLHAANQQHALSCADVKAQPLASRSREEDVVVRHALGVAARERVRARPPPRVGGQP
mmetsp:Transcript_102526/g.296516  ORF Transcript_102526/g.296516 Transcript_102526/m.296516 type:complete len:530 (-) Transcript_102526:316-1905(-)